MKNLKALIHFWTSHDCVRGSFDLELYYRILKAREE